ncbi:hypothetical protein AVDCRST_MAG81-406 [uncultured Synechococcales cyanobacterium]|uniref:Uncharacterized protein n=1 Tax=uncultured Synechococcales cyanobacterium TaxID=1936017 RepID=A0A6J4USH3_9CYAN|nr:hypothetical protein AVDCRST_MAG81-406 [uncultured Synechococcales cyanobacterium]
MKPILAREVLVQFEFKDRNLLSGKFWQKFTSDRLQHPSLPQNWYALIHVMAGTTGVAIGLIVAVTLGWMG